MISPDQFIAALERAGIRFVTGVPDSLLKDVCAAITAHFPADRHVLATNEGSAIGLAIGHYLACRRPALVYMQNSGLGNAINPITSLADPAVYGIPMVLLIGWRGELAADGSQLPDEPQHVQQGRITPALLDVLDIPYRVIGPEAGAIAPILDAAAKSALDRGGPVALLVRKNSFETFRLPKPAACGDSITREAAIAAIVQALPSDVPVVSTTGMASRELFELRKAGGAGHQRDFLTVGGMGHASQIAAGIALARPGAKVVCLDGDGALLMHAGGLALSADCSNLIHIVLNNGAHDSVGGQPTKAASLQLTGIASACGYAAVAQASGSDEIKRHLSAMLEGGRSAFLEVRCARGARSDLGRPDRSPAMNKADFIRFLQGGEDGR